MPQAVPFCLMLSHSPTRHQATSCHNHHYYRKQGTALTPPFAPPRFSPSTPLACERWQLPSSPCCPIPAHHPPKPPCVLSLPSVPCYHPQGISFAVAPVKLPCRENRAASLIAIVRRRAKRRAAPRRREGPPLSAGPSPRRRSGPGNGNGTDQIHPLMYRTANAQ